jgi:hypothetical protein
MSKTQAIMTEADCGAALARIDALMDAGLGTPEGDELDILADLSSFMRQACTNGLFPQGGLAKRNPPLLAPRPRGVGVDDGGWRRQHDRGGGGAGGDAGTGGSG